MPHVTTCNVPVAVCAAVICHQGKVLLTKRPDDKLLGGYWEFPGGKIDENESPHFALKRELREELDIEIEVGVILESVYHRYQWGNALILAYLCSWTNGTIKHLEVADHSWVIPTALASYDILPADRPIVAKIEKLAAAGSLGHGKELI